MLFRKLALFTALYCTSSAATGQHHDGVLHNASARKGNLRSLQSHIKNEINKPSSSNTASLGTSDETGIQPQQKVSAKKVKTKESKGSAKKAGSDGLHMSSTNVNNGNSNNSNKKRFVVVCDDVEKCESEMTASMKGVNVVQKMKNTPNVAVEMSAEEAAQMDSLFHVRRVEDDQLRTTFHIPESNRPITDRRLQIGQYEDYGIGYVNAREVWETYKDIFGEDVAKGSRAKVCIIDTGIRVTHNDLDDNRIDGSDFEGLTWVRDLQESTKIFRFSLTVSNFPFISWCT